ncbi:glycosyltransferase involved in cell wall biosynthesis [Flavobacterium cutihirudinis]|uniref:Glycosyltransferase involved in cell wall biosynthesis n=2 Tax=Flavobacterium cutihirudinis TaxID=1265740 RepID=A0A3D9FKL0_9FLAO|nr:glycosyltransferase involved in cell wall biosynthesis [Flavobacterium cutihirudinis]
MSQLQRTYYIYHLTNSVHEGGMARNNAFYQRFLDLNAVSLNVYSKSIIKRLWMSIKALWVLIFLKNKNIFIHQGSLFVLFPVFLMRISFFKKWIFYLLNRLARRNKFMLEVNDLPYEQSIDLELHIDDIYKLLQDRLYTIKGCYYIFASNEMASYAALKYSIQDKYFKVIINGAPELFDCPAIFNDEKWITSTDIKFVYAGSLNKGRQIEDLLTIFRENKNNLLIILGNNGEWLKTLDLPANIIYLGNFEEREAHYLVSKCDVGIIPYNEERFYYNLCFPTKVSFYLTAGLPILTTPLKELQQVFKDKKALLFVSFTNWSTTIKNLNTSEILIMKESVKNIKDSYSWKAILNENKFD